MNRGHTGRNRPGRRLLVTDTVFVWNPAWVSDGTLYSTVMLADSPAAMVPRLQSKPAQLPCDEETAPMSKPAGKLSSVTVTLSASDTPSLSTLMVYW